MMYKILRPFLFLLPPEVAHSLTLSSLQLAHKLKLTNLYKTITAPQEVMGIKFPNFLGLAAGLDKNGDYFHALSALGFGFVEIGTVTPKPQSGNPKPRLFRLVKEEALINRMGFNNLGLDYVEDQLARQHFAGILGINIGKNKDTPLDNAIEDYLTGFKRMAPYAKYITINISSPNTEGLRDLQKSDLLWSLLTTLKTAQSRFERYVPLVVKVAPDLTQDEIAQIAETLLAVKIDGLIATNTTLSREEIKNSKFAKEAGGLSGKPLCSRSTKVVRQFHELLQDKIPIIACGGISNATDALEKLNAGAQLLQVYTGLIYQGPGLIKEIAKKN